LSVKQLSLFATPLFSKKNGKARRVPVRHITADYVAEIADVPNGNKRMTLRERFFAGIEASTNECWIWKAHKNGNGYGYIKVGEFGNFYVHRLAYLMYVGDIPYGHYVMHKCDTPACVYPGHLETGTQHENITDSVRKGRHVVSGTHDKSGRITTEHVNAIRSSYFDQGVSITELSRQYGVGYMCIYRIVKGLSWKYVAKQRRNAA